MEVENKRPNVALLESQEHLKGKSPKRSKTCNQYDGYRFDSEDTTPAVAILDKIPDSRTFFKTYIAQRRPVIIKGHNLNGKRILEALSQMEASVVVVEQRRSCYERFGQDRKQSVNMTVAEFAEYCQKKSKHPEHGMYYLSTQHRKETGEFVPPKPHYGTPCNVLVEQNILPRQLELAGNLILESVNLWMGVSSNYHVSGLHHDFHDNFYHVISGRKTFQIFAPHEAPNLAVSGTIDCIYPNGLISYLEHPTRQDGVPIDPTPESEVQEDDDDDDNGDKGFTIGRGFDYESSDDDEEDYPEAAEEEEDEEEDEVTEDKESDKSPVRRRESLNSLGGSPPRDNLDIPCHFSFIDPTVDTNKITYTFPDYKFAVSSTVDLEAGDIFYLPAGWFHCVSSFGGHETAEPTTGVSPHIHMAVNYWFHPPDNRSNYERPYVDHAFWNHSE